MPGDVLMSDEILDLLNFGDLPGGVADDGVKAALGEDGGVVVRVAVRENPFKTPPDAEEFDLPMEKTLATGQHEQLPQQTHENRPKGVFELKTQGRGVLCHESRLENTGCRKRIRINVALGGRG